MNNLERNLNLEKIAETGLVAGKFYPPHHGHKYLIDTARSKVDRLDVIVLSKEDQYISGELRSEWIKNIHKDVNVIHRPDSLPPMDSERWAEQTLTWLGHTPQVVFSSEDYGEAYAEYMGAQNYLVDRGREVKKVSGTMIRNNPLENLDLLEPVVRGYFVKRICVIGAESTGTTTLSKALAKHYKTLLVPEYGRTYSQVKYAKGDRHWSSDEFEVIAKEQQRQEDEMAKSANKILICDTNAFATEIFHEFYMGSISEKVAKYGEETKADLYIVTDANIPFVQDGLRETDEIRQKMHKRFLDELRNRNLPFILVSGSREERLKEATSAIDFLLEKRPS